MIQMMLPIMLVPTSASGDGTATRPNGHRAKLASLNACRPNGIVMISTQAITPATR